jgi:hypothetical protein
MVRRKYWLKKEFLVKVDPNADLNKDDDDEINTGKQDDNDNEEKPAARIRAKPGEKGNKYNIID